MCTSSSDWMLSPQFLVGSSLFLAGMYINISSDYNLLAMRMESLRTGKGPLKKYSIPRGGFFEYVSCANYCKSPTYLSYIYIHLLMMITYCFLDSWGNIRVDWICNSVLVFVGLGFLFLYHRQSWTTSTSGMYCIYIICDVSILVLIFPCILFACIYI
jgi:hypothetical protein